MEKQSEQYYWSTKQIVAAVEQFLQENNRLPVAREMNPQNGLPVRKTFERKMGMTWGQYTKLHYPKLCELNDQRHKQRVLDIRSEMSEWTKEKLILAVEQFVEQNGRLPLNREYTAENGLPSYTTFNRIAEQAMADYLENRFSEYISQGNSPDDMKEEIQTETVSLGMKLTL